MAIQMSDKFKKNLPPGGNHPGFSKPTGKVGSFQPNPDKAAGQHPGFQKPTGKVGNFPANPDKVGAPHPGFQKPTGKVGNFKPNPDKVAGQHPGFQKPTGKVGNFPPNPAKTGGTIKLDRREMDGTFNNAAPKKGVSGTPVKSPGIKKFQPAAKPKAGAHQEFVKRAKAAGIKDKDINKFVASKIRPKAKR